MLMPILAERSVALPGISSTVLESATSTQVSPRSSLTISGLQSDVALKIIETLNRHFMGEAVLPQEALTRLVDVLAKALNFPQLPQESTVDFARRLASFLETLPPEVRQIAEKQLGLRPQGLPVKALAEALRNPGSINAARIATVLDTAPQAAPGTGGRQGVPTQQQQQGAQGRTPLQLAASLATALAAPVAEANVLQATLKRTFGADDDTATPVRLPSTKGETTNAARQNSVQVASGALDDAAASARQTLQSQSRPTGETLLPLAAILAQHSILEEAIQAPPLPATIEEQRVIAEITAGSDLPEESRLLNGSPGLADVISHLPEQAAEALLEKLAETLKDFAEMEATALVDPETAGDGTDRPVLASPDQAGVAEIEFLLSASFDTPGPDTARARNTINPAALPLDQPASDDKDMAHARQQILNGTAEQPRDMPMVFRNAEMAVARELIPFAMLHYLPAPNEIVGETEENRRPYERDGEPGQESADEEQGHDEHPASADNGAASLAEATGQDESPDDQADNEAYQLYIRMGGIL